MKGQAQSQLARADRINRFEIYQKNGILERDLNRLKEKHEIRCRNIQTIILVCLIFSLILTLAIKTGQHFINISTTPQNCLVSQYNALKGFVSQCKICNNGWENVNGICVKVV